MHAEDNPMASKPAAPAMAQNSSTTCSPGVAIGDRPGPQGKVRNGMCENENSPSFREALARIVEVANDAMNAGEDTEHEHGEASSGHVQKDRLVCSPKSLPQRVLIKAAETAVKINPMNAVVFASAQAAASLILEP